MFERLRSIEGVDFHALLEDARNRGYAGGRDVEVSGSEHLSGKADVGIAAISITAAREKQFEFSQPILNSGLQIMLRSQDQNGIKGPEDLVNKRVATTHGSTAAEFLREIKASVYEFANIRSVYNALLDNTVDAVVFDAPVLLYYAANEGKGRVAMSGQSWSRLSEQFFRVDKWSLCRG